MPTAVTRKHPIDQHLQEIFREDERCLAEFSEDHHWHQSTRGNWWRHWGDKVVTIFKRRGRFTWCIAGGPKPIFTPRSYEDFEGALSAAASYLRIYD